MTRKPIVAIDVDDTVLPIFEDWMLWYAEEQWMPVESLHHVLKNYHSGKEDMMNHAAIYPKKIGWYEQQSEAHTPEDFWKSPDLYDDRSIPEETLEVLHRLHQKYDIVYVSHCYPEHENSKKKMLERSLGRNIKFISTPHKEYVDFDVIIDDNVEVIERCHARGKDTIWFMNKDILETYFKPTYYFDVYDRLMERAWFKNWHRIEKHLSTKLWL